MFCKHCGSKVEGHHLFCPTCGERLDSHKKRFPTLLKWLSAVLILGALISGYLFYNKEEPQKTIQEQLVALKNNQLTEAYYSYTAKEFQKATPLEKFKEIIRSFHPLSEVKEINVDDSEEKDDRTRLNVTLKTDDKKSFKMEYDLVKEEGNWKIIFFKLLSNPVEDVEDEAASLEEPKESAYDLINRQLDYLRDGKIDEAYTDLVSRDFKKETSLKTFKDFISANPILSDFVSYKQGVQTSENNIKRIRVVLSGTKDEKHIVDYSLIQEGDKWLINGMQLLPYDESESKSLETPPQFNNEEIKTYITQFVDAIKNSDFTKAYQDYTTEEFKKATNEEIFTKTIKGYPSFINNETLDIRGISFKNNVGSVVAFLQSKDDKRMAQFDLMLNNNVWKIQQIQIYKAPEADDMKVKVVEIGTKKDDKGEITDVASNFTNPPQEIFVNVFLSNVRKGNKITLMLINEEQKIKSPEISHEISVDAADYVAFFSFSAPKTGWPPGAYKVIGETNTGDKVDSSFTIE